MSISIDKFMDYDTECAVLGAMILEKDSLLVGFELITEEKVFYDDRNRVIYKSMKSLAAKSSDVDQITIIHELRTTGHLEAIGGAVYVVDLTSKISNGTHIESHIRILLEKYMRRVLVEQSDRMRYDALNPAKDVLEIIPNIQNAIGSVLSNAIKKDAVSIKDSILNAVEVMQNKNSGKIKSGIPTGFSSIDKNLSGWQNGDLIIIAGRPGMGKTTFALNSMVSALELGYKPYVLSLEMSGLQLTNKIIAQKMGFSPAQIRHGHVNGDDSARVLSELPQVFYTDNMLIDDNVGINIHDLRAKITSVKRSHGIDILMVDYLQLIQSRIQNREQAISEISRNLKILAKELDIPVIALSQLSRSAEARSDKKPLLSDLRECLSVDTSLIYTSNGIKKNTASDMRLLSLEDTKFVSKDSLNVTKESNIVYRITTSTGRYIDATSQHNVLTTDGYKMVKDITTNDVLILAKNFETEGIYYKESRLIGLMIGNGCMTGKSGISFITSCKVVSDYFCDYIKKEFNMIPREHRHNISQKVYQWDVAIQGKGKKGINHFKEWLKSKDLIGRKSYEKYIPEWFMESADTKSICELIAGLIETDGSVYIVKERNTVSYSTTSYKLATQILYLLAKIGIIANIDEGYMSKKANFLIYKITINDSFYLKIFREKINLIGYKSEKLLKLNLDRRVSYTANKVSHTTSKEISKMIKKGRLQIHGGRCATQETLIKLSKNNDLGSYKWLISENIHLDKVKKIKQLGEVNVFDRSVPSTSNYVVNGIVVHNSGAIEQDADTVMFIFRPEYYNITEWEDGTPTKDTASVIIAKNRNGALDEIMLSCRLQNSIFEDYKTQTEYGKISKSSSWGPGSF